MLKEIMRQDYEDYLATPVGYIQDALINYFLGMIMVVSLCLCFFIAYYLSEEYEKWMFIESEEIHIGFFLAGLCVCAFLLWFKMGLLYFLIFLATTQIAGYFLSLPIRAELARNNWFMAS